jgi:hypothetical protein
MLRASLSRLRIREGLHAVEKLSCRPCDGRFVPNTNRKQASKFQRVELLTRHFEQYHDGPRALASVICSI